VSLWAIEIVDLIHVSDFDDFDSFIVGLKCFDCCTLVVEVRVDGSNMFDVLRLSCHGHSVSIMTSVCCCNRFSVSVLFVIRCTRLRQAIVLTAQSTFITVPSQSRSMSQIWNILADF